MTRHWYKQPWCIAVLLVLLSTAGIISSYTQFSQTADEPWHIFCGMRWWHHEIVEPPKGVAANPPLGELMATAPLFFANTIAPPENMSQRDKYMRRVVLTRLGILPFYLLSCLLVVVWSRQLFGMTSALWSLALYVSLSTVTANAGLVTTDMAYTAMFLCALWSGIRWLDRPGIANSIMLGESVGLMIGTKFSGLIQWPAAMAIIITMQAIVNCERSLSAFSIRRAHIISLACILPLSFLMLGLLYNFSFRTLFHDIHVTGQFNAHGFVIWLFGPLPHAVWYFFPVVFFFKTPLPFHFASILGNWRLIEQLKRGESLERLFPLLAALAVMLVSMTGNINLGVRHVLPVYPLLSIPAGYGLMRLWEHDGWKRAIAFGALFWQGLGFIFAYPDHLAYFNELAGNHPEHISLDSDFDWGQGMVKLDQVLEANGADGVHLCLRGLHVNEESARVVLHAVALGCPEHPVSGWVAISRAVRVGQQDKFAWLDEYGTAKPIGKTLDLYYIPADRIKQ